MTVGCGAGGGGGGTVTVGGGGGTVTTGGGGGTVTVGAGSVARTSSGHTDNARPRISASLRMARAWRSACTAAR